MSERAPMSMLFRAQGSDPRPGTDDALKIFDHWEPPSRYLTDGTSLYR
jgi:hypothetical protein